eukprot:TRINITY_DN22200_c0_g1_i1.p2 TRINITY_DN22200_c0_g1~~TRINITY_DN22200_c0_g1_i1.p2  ORF type:complete len:178 (+),score=32.33 TRINITY_DN22200_c0_g1_i1:305-838(+)
MRRFLEGVILQGLDVTQNRFAPNRFFPRLSAAGAEGVESHASDILFGDTIAGVEIDSQEWEVRYPGQLWQALATVLPGTNVRVTFLRKNPEEKQYTVTLRVVTGGPTPPGVWPSKIAAALEPSARAMAGGNAQLIDVAIIKHGPRLGDFGTLPTQQQPATTPLRPCEMLGGVYGPPL